jgi:hypothetical protein
MLETWGIERFGVRGCGEAFPQGLVQTHAAGLG